MRHLHLLLFLLLAGFWPSSPAGAAEAEAVKCAVNEDRVWVYDSLIQFNVEAKLRCGEAVEIIGRAKGYVKIRTRSGLEGYVLESAFPNLPPLVENNDQPGGSPASGQQPPAKSLRPSARVAPNPALTPTRANPTVSKNAGAVGENASVAPARPSESVSSAAPVAQPASATSYVAAHPVEKAKPAVHKAAAPEAAVIENARGGTVAPPAAPAPTERTPAVMNNVPPVEVTISTRPADATAEVRPHVAAAVGRGADEPDDDAEIPPETVHEDYSACQEFFSAYGLTQAQFKWIVQNRKKKHPNVCPAPTIAMVDYVVIFTHDVNFYGSTMPAAVHTDPNGFSDFIPLMLMDSTLVSETEADKARHEYVWVFHTKRGTYDPARFSPRRRPQFTKSASNAFGSHAGPRVVEDAFQFIEGRGASR
jgi:hypothetical protein